MENKNELAVFVGQNFELVLPSGAIAIIREHSAADDDILSTNQKGKSSAENFLHNLNRYVAEILQNKPYDPESKQKPTLKDVENLRLKDKHYIIFKSRILSIGENLDLNYTCPSATCGAKDEFEIDLTQYDRDLSLSHEELADMVDDDKLCITPYKVGYQEKTFEVNLSSGRTVVLEYLNGNGENYVLAQSKNNNLKASSDIISRRPKIEIDGSLQEIKNVNIFSKRDKVEITKAIKKLDDQFPMSILVTCEGCGRQEFIPLIAIQDFFFPEEM